MTSAIKRVNRNGSRYYVKDDVWMVSVTTVLGIIDKPGLPFWANKLGREAFRAYLEPFVGKELTAGMLDVGESLAKDAPKKGQRKAGNYGTKAHDIIHSLILGNPIEIPEEFAPVAQAFLSWRATSGITIHLSEMELYSEEHGFYGGTVDAVGKDSDGNTWVIDWKTSNAMHQEYAMQVAAYAKGYEEIYGGKVAGAWIIRFDRDRPIFEAAKVTDLETAFIGFQSALRLWKVSKLELFSEYQNQRNLLP